MCDRRRHIIWAIVALTTLVAATVAAQAHPGTADSGLVVSLSSFVSVAGLGLGGGALVAWGRQGQTLTDYDSRLSKLEEDRVTRAEHLTVQSDIREIRRILERRSAPRTGGPE